MIRTRNRVRRDFAFFVNKAPLFWKAWYYFFPCRLNGEGRKLLKYLCTAVLLIVAVYITWWLVSFAHYYFVVCHPSNLSVGELRTCSGCNNPDIPRILHHSWKNSTVPEKWKQTYDSCLDTHKEYEYMFWTDEKMEKFMEKEYGWFMDTYRSYPFPIQRVDAVRYFILFHYGGIYIDLDIGCNVSLPDILSNGFHYNVLVAATYPTGVSNQIMMAPRGHALFKAAMFHLGEQTTRWLGTPYTTVMWSTGPMFLTKVISENVPLADILIIPQDQVFTKYFWRVSGGSWHNQWDSKMFATTGEILKTPSHIEGVLLCVFVTIVATVCLFVYKRRKSSLNIQHLFWLFHIL